MEKFSNKVADWIVKYNPDSLEQYDIYVYAVQCICGFLLSNGIILGIATVLHFPLQAFIWLVFYNCLRFFIGGSHAQTFKVCLAGGTVFSLACIAAATYLTPINILLMLEIIFCVWVVYFIAPVIHENRSLSKRQIIRKHRIGKVIVMIECLTIYIFYHYCGGKLAHSAALGMFAAALLCLIGKRTQYIKNRKSS